MKDIYLEKNKLLKKGIQLRNLTMEDSKNSNKIRKEQDKLYKKWKFYDEFLKASNKK